MAINPLPKWAMYRYARLWKSFRDREFTFEEASAILDEKDANLPSVILSFLRKNGWLTIRLDPSDARRRIYQLVDPVTAIEGMEVGA